MTFSFEDCTAYYNAELANCSPRKTSFSWCLVHNVEKTILAKCVGMLLVQLVVARIAISRLPSPLLFDNFGVAVQVAYTYYRRQAVSQ